MAFNFDLNSALAGAKTVSELVNAPREMAMREQMQAEQIASSQQQRALAGQQLEASKFDLGQKQKVVGDEAAVRAANSFLAQVDAYKIASIEKASPKSTAPPAEKWHAVAPIIQPGHIEVLKNSKDGGVSTVKQGDAIVAAATTLLQNPTPPTAEQINPIVDAAAKYQGQFQKEYDPNSFRGQLVNGKVVVYAKDHTGKEVEVDQSDPVNFLKSISSDNRILSSVVSGVNAGRALHGDATVRKELQDKSEWLTTLGKLEDQAVTPEIKQNISILKSIRPEAGMPMLAKLMEHSDSEMKTNRGMEAQALTAPIISLIKKNASGMVGSKAAEYISNPSQDVNDWMTNSANAASIAKIKALGFNPQDIIQNQLMGKSTLLEASEKIGKLRTEETTAAAHKKTSEAAIAAANKKGVTGESSEAIKATLASYDSELKGLLGNVMKTPAENARAEYLKGEVDRLRNALLTSKATPSGKRAVAIPSAIGTNSRLSGNVGLSALMDILGKNQK